MRQLPSGPLVWSTRDISDFDRCPWSVAMGYHSITSGSWPAPPLDHPLRELMARALDDHRDRVFRTLATQPGQIIDFPDGANVADLIVASTEAATITRPHVTFTDPTSQLTIAAHADAMVREESGRYRIHAIRLGRSSMRQRLLALAGFRVGLEALGITCHDSATVTFSDCIPREFDLTESVQLWTQLTAELATMVSQLESKGVALGWSDSPLNQCGRQGCAWCQNALARNDDLFHIARLRRSTRRELTAHGINTMTQLAETSVDELHRALPLADQAELRRAQIQATLQVLTTTSTNPTPATEIIDQQRLSALPEGRPGDIYLDCEGDPSYHQWGPDSLCTPHGNGTDTWMGIDYLIGVFDPDDRRYHSWWADDFEGEERAWGDFFAWLSDRRARHPKMSIYHYASYELTALQRMAIRYQTGQSRLTAWLEGDVFVDLYRTVMASLAVGTPGYSLKDLEALYWSPSHRRGIVGGGESVLAFSTYRHSTDPTVASDIKQSILDYNAADTESTYELHRWLIGRRQAHRAY